MDDNDPILDEPLSDEREKLSSMSAAREPWPDEPGRPPVGVVDDDDRPPGYDPAVSDSAGTSARETWDGWGHE